MPAAGPTDPLAVGKYLALTSCSECHGMDLRGQPTFGAPSLMIAAGYPDADFATQMRAGVALGGRKLDLMREVALERFAHLTDDEVQALHRYLKTLVNEKAS
jgi:mono/diheme cytochrome c family protein